MYIIKTITRSDGSTYESAFWQSEKEVFKTEDQLTIERAIEAFGSSS